MHLLLAEDDPFLSDALTTQLQGAGHTVKHAPNGPVADYLAQNETFDLIILDIGLPMVDGLTVLRQLRAANAQVPVIILTAQDGLDSRVAGFNAGADDYVIKPFDFAELELRLRALMRRAGASGAAGEVSVASLVFEPKGRRATVNGTPVDLSPREAALLDLLVAHRDSVVTKEAIMQAWANDNGGSATGNAPEVYIHRLRRRLDGAGVDIRTVRGVGYMLVAEKHGSARQH